MFLKRSGIRRRLTSAATFLSGLLIVLATLNDAFAADKKLPNKKGDAHALPAGARELNIGDPAPDFELPGIDGKTHRLADYKEAKLLMIAFISNHCPDSHAAEGRIKQLLGEMKGKGLTLVAINPNNPDGLRLDELGYSKYNDGFDDMKKYATEQGFTFPYLYDGETQAIAKAYGCLATPHVFIFDAERKLRYKGQFDDSRFAEASTVKSQDARQAVEALLAGRPVPVEVTKPHGCSTKWMEKKSSVAVADAKQAATPVEVELIDTAGVAALRKNGTAKVRLFNVWATWCAPCVAEFPELVTTARKFGLRDFELITLSTDEPKDIAKAKAFLEKKGAAPGDKLKRSIKDEGRKTNSYLYRGADVNELMKVLDPEWAGGIPHSVLVAPDGKIIWRHNGAVDGDELRAQILQFMGPYYKP
jgi:peroxiredoxin